MQGWLRTSAQHHREQTALFAVLGRARAPYVVVAQFLPDPGEQSESGCAEAARFRA